MPCLSVRPSMSGARASHLLREGFHCIQTVLELTPGGLGLACVCEYVSVHASVCVWTCM